LAKFTIKKLFFLYFSIWLFNEFSYESMIWIRMHVFSLIMIVFYKNEFYSMIENVLCILFTTFYFLGFSSAMAHSMETLNEEANIDDLTRQTD